MRWDPQIQRGSNMVLGLSLELEEGVRWDVRVRLRSWVMYYIYMTDKKCKYVHARACVCGGERQFPRMRVTRGRGAHFSNVVIRETEKQGLKERYVQSVCVGTKREGSPYQLSPKP